MSEKRKVVIDRSKWARVTDDLDTPHGYSMLLNCYSSMCCLGFLSQQICGKRENDLIGRTAPHRNWLLEAHLEKLNVNECVAINDRFDRDFPSDADQEAAIAAEFAKVNLEVEFVN